jgi:uncharacterized protein YqjF (DUF2071 family)
MVQQWECVTFLHWRYDREIVERLVPYPLEVETFDGAAWVGLVPFITEVRFGVRLSRFPETNVRTYVRGPDGGRGVWFFSLDAPCIAAVAAARIAYKLPYMWARMTVERQGGVVRYRSCRKWPNRGRRADIEVAHAAPVPAGELETFLTARFRLYTFLGGGRPAVARVAHPAWELRRAEVRVLQEDLVAAAGLPAPRSAPLAHYSPGVTVTVGPLAPAL